MDKRCVLSILDARKNAKRLLSEPMFRNAATLDALILKNYGGLCATNPYFLIKQDLQLLPCRDFTEYLMSCESICCLG